MHLSNKKGSALISALFIMTLVAIAATAMATRLQLEIHRTKTEQNANKILLASEAINFWAMGQLLDAKNLILIPNKNAQVLQFPLKRQAFYPGLQVKGQVFDLQGKFNLNNIKDKKEAALFSRILKNSIPKLAETEINELLFATIDWISPLDLEKGKNPFEDFYLSQKPSYGISHLPFHSPSEWRLVKGVTAAIFNTIEPFITTLPDRTPINLNAAPKEILKALGNGLNDAEVEELINARKKGIKNLADIKPLLQKLNISNQQITLQSNYFLVRSEIELEKMNRQTYAIFKRSINNNTREITLQLIAHTINTL